MLKNMSKTAFSQKKLQKLGRFFITKLLLEKVVIILISPNQKDCQSSNVFHEFRLICFCGFIGKFQNFFENFTRNGKSEGKRGKGKKPEVF